MISRSLGIAMLAGNPAFGGILQRALQDDGGHKVASFEGVEALTTYLRIAPVDVVILDTELPGAPAIDIAGGLRQHMTLATPDFYILGLTRTPTPFHKPLLAAGIDRVLTKPVTPSTLLAEVEALFETHRAVATANAPAAIGLGVRPFDGGAIPPARVGNVIPLFGEGRERR
jgi:DNA-binding response OmpR family regulator